MRGKGRDGEGKGKGRVMLRRRGGDNSDVIEE